MKKQYYALGLIATFAIIAAWLFIRPSNPKTDEQKNAPTSDDAASAMAKVAETSEPIKSGLTASNPIETSQLIQAAAQDRIRTETLANQMGVERNLKPQDYYGKLIDQHGEPIPDADITGTLTVLLEGTNEKHTTYKTSSDQDGLFEFTGLTGWRLDFVVRKAGYELGARGEGYKRQVGERTSPTDRAILTMWKPKGAEPLIHDEKFYSINPDGRVYTIDLVNKKKTEGQDASGDLLVQIKRPPHIQPTEKYNWSFVLSVINGGIIEVDGGYLYEAPENGYKNNFEINMLAAELGWKSQIEKTFFVKSRDGQVYGHFHVTIISDYREASAFKIDSFINPAGSRNLELDPVRVSKAGQ